MTAITESLTQRFEKSVGGRFNWRYFMQDNITGSWILTVWVIALTAATIYVTVSQLAVSPTTTIIVLVAWVVGIGFAISSGLFKKRTSVGMWLHVNLMSSISNILLTLILTLIVVAGVRNFWSWGVVNATFSPEMTSIEDRNPDGATWGVIPAAWDLLMIGRLDRESMPRVQMSLAFVVVMGVITLVTTKVGLWKRNEYLRKGLLGIWAASPIVLYILLAGVPDPDPFINIQTLIAGEVAIMAVYGLLFWQKTVRFSIPSLIGWIVIWPISYVIWQAIGQSKLFPPINVATWGGLMLTMIIASSVIILSFPLGLVLALGRRSEVRGIPWWIIWPVSIVATIWALATSTTEILPTAQNTIQKILAFWPILILAIAYILQKNYSGNVIAAASTAFIEFIRGVPLITLLFMAIIMAPFFLADGVILPGVYAVIVGYAIFSAAYMAELIRGGLQALPQGQYEAADSLGLNTLQKMRFIILPQALRVVIPGIVGQFIGSFKSSSLVAIVGLFELLGIVRIIVANPDWLGLRLELYVFAGAIYFTGSFIMSWYSRRLEVKLGVGQR